MSADDKLELPKREFRSLNLFSLTFGLISAGTLALSISTDFWLYTSEPTEQEYQECETCDKIRFEYVILAHSGLWRCCLFFEESESAGPSPCTNIGYTQVWERVDGGETTTSILRAIRKSSPIIVSSLFLLTIALGLSTIGNAKRDTRTLIGGVFYIFAALCLAMGIIFYISAVNDEVAHRKKPEATDVPVFEYHYGWAFFFNAVSFISSMAASVTNISLFIRRYGSIEEMSYIIPGLIKHSNYDFQSIQENLEESYQGQPTLIL